MPKLPPYRDTVIQIPRNGIGAVSSLGLGQKDVLPLWFGESDVPTPAFIREAAKAALDDGQTFYTFSRGLPQLRAEIQAWTKRHYGAALEGERVSSPGSAMMSIQIALQLTVEPASNIVVVYPIWPNIFNAIRTIGAEPRFQRLGRDARSGRWSLDLDALFARCDGQTKAIFVCSPGNPTGWIMPAGQQRELLDFSRKRGIAIISDEVYSPLVIDERAPSFVNLATDEDAVFIVHSFSKAWAMTGWRIGWLIHAKALEPWIAELANIDNTGSATFAQYGAVAALRDGDPFIVEMADRCRAGRAVVDRFLAGQNRIRWIRPEGAFYGFLEIDGMTDSLDFAKRLLKDHRVGVAPGMAFGPEGDAENDRHIRICFAQDAGRLVEGLEKLGRAVK
jgi:aspartate/methionine/tyrosine aminotransferase